MEGTSHLGVEWTRFLASITCGKLSHRIKKVALNKDGDIDVLQKQKNHAIESPWREGERAKEKIKEKEKGDVSET